MAILSSPARISRVFPFVAWAVALQAGLNFTAGLTYAEERPRVDFARQVYPVLLARCFACHQGADAASGVRLDLRPTWLGEATGEPLAIPGRSHESRVLELVRADAEEKMPPKGPRLTADQVAVLRDWIDQGLRWDEKLLPPPELAQKHWSFQPVRRPSIPLPARPGWSENPVDAFVAQTHEQRGLTPAAEAPRRALIRRLALDVTGLPPTPAEIESFLHDTSPNAYEKLVEHYLSSPHYGVRWGRHWLDLARWAETEGYESNHGRPFAWRYRDYVVRSFNEDKPYDQFLLEQLAGDELEPYLDENLIATGFLAAARLSSNEEDKPLQRNDVLIDIVNATGNALLGLTFHCAQCHDHKFDPLSQRDYYSFQGFFLQGQCDNLALREGPDVTAYRDAKPTGFDAAAQLLRDLQEDGRARRIEAAKSKWTPAMKAAFETPAAQRTPEQRELARQADLSIQFTTSGLEKGIRDENRPLYQELKKRLEEWQKTLPPRPQTWGFHAVDSPHTFDVLPMKGFYPLEFEPALLRAARPAVLHRGNVHHARETVPVAWPSFLSAPPDQAKIAFRPRTALAKWLCRPENPLTARVWVNRVWHYHFGRGLVSTPEDFGVKGAAPSHPELLDWLAAELSERGWSTKHIHRLLLNSRAYRQASTPNSSNAKLDPENRYLWHWQPRRLEAEAIRDSALAVSGELDPALAGPSVTPEQAEQRLRRSIYLLQKRDDFPPQQALFDGPTALESCAQRFVSTVALQPLYLLNHPFMTARAAAFARRVQAQVGPDPARQGEVAFALALGRAPDDTERNAIATFLSDAPQNFSQDSRLADSPPQKLVHFCQALLNLNEFVYLE